MSDKHIFALYLPHSYKNNELTIGKKIGIIDCDFWHRLIHVLHAKEGDAFIFFNTNQSISVTLESISKKGTVIGHIYDLKALLPLSPSINLFQGLLKREALHEVAYLAAQMGATSLNLIKTEKINRSWGGEKELDRMRNVMIAACEQSKQFVIPQIIEPVDLLQAIKASQLSTHTLSIFCEPEGTNILKFLQEIAAFNYPTINIFIGPEGGFTKEERSTLEQAGIRACALTPTILRSQEAVAVVIGVFRSVTR